MFKCAVILALAFSFASLTPVGSQCEPGKGDSKRQRKDVQTVRKIEYEWARAYANRDIAALDCMSQALCLGNRTSMKTHNVIHSHSPLCLTAALATQSDDARYSYRVSGKVTFRKNQSPPGATVYVMGTRPIGLQFSVDAPMVTTIIVVSILFPMMYPILIWFQTKRGFTNLQKFQRNIRYQFTLAGYDVADLKSSAHMDWDAILRAVESRHSFNIFFHRSLFHVIPKRCFRNAADIGRLRSLLKQVWLSGIKERYDKLITQL